MTKDGAPPAGAQGSAAPLARLSALGQSVWVDFLSRGSIRSGHLQRLIDDYSVVGATSNPTIFDKAMGEGDAYDEEIAALGKRTDDAAEIFWTLAQHDVSAACDVFHDVWERIRSRRRLCLDRG